MDLDVTFFMQLGLITLFIVVLRPLLVTPLMGVMDARHQQTHGARAEARRIERLTDLDKEAYEAKLRRARHEVHLRREQQRQSAREQAQALLEAARKEAAQTVLVHRQGLREAEQAALVAMRGTAAGQARALVSRLLGREVVL